MICEECGHEREAGFHCSPCLSAENAKLRAEVARLDGIKEVYRLEAFDLQAKLRTVDLQLEVAKKCWDDDLKWAMDKNAALIIALEHELKGSYPCSPDCAGKIRDCSGCDDRARAALKGVVGKRYAEPHFSPEGKCRRSDCNCT